MIAKKDVQTEVALVAGPVRQTLTTDKSGHARLLVHWPERAVEKVKCEDLPGMPYVTPASATDTWVGVYGAIPEAEVTVSFVITNLLEQR